MDSSFDPIEHPHRRLNPLTNQYVLVSPHRMKRPWQGQTERPQSADIPQYDPTCYLCPGNTRSSGQKNPEFSQVFTFENDFAAILPPPVPEAPPPSHRLLLAESIHGGCDVLVFHPRHDLTLARFPVSHIIKIIDEWIRVYNARGSQPGIRYVQIFENKGSMMGCSNPHPHGQVWSLSAIPSIVQLELENLEEYAISDVACSDAPRGPHGRPCMLCDYAHLELNSGDVNKRLVYANDHWLAVVPWWAVWPFEILLLPHHRHIASIADLADGEKASLAEILAKVTIKYDNLFTCSFAYSMGIHQRPTPRNSVEDEHDVAHVHFHFLPPLLRNADVRKFLVGFELMAEPQRDLTPEQAARRLGACSEIHYLDKQ